MEEYELTLLDKKIESLVGWMEQAADSGHQAGWVIGRFKGAYKAWPTEYELREAMKAANLPDRFAQMFSSYFF